MRFTRLRAAVAALMTTCVLSVPGVAVAKTARNYCCDWSAIGGGSFWPAAVSAAVFQANKGYSVVSGYSVHSGNVYNALKLEGLLMSGSHANAGIMVFRRSDDTWSCITTYGFALPHKHSVSGVSYSKSCAANYNIAALAGDSPCAMALWLGCYTLNDPGASGDSLPWACYYEGIDHACGFSKSVLTDSWTGDWSYGYWQSLAAGNYTNKAMQDAEAYVRSKHGGKAGGYDSCNYVGLNMKI